MRQKKEATPTTAIAAVNAVRAGSLRNFVAGGQQVTSHTHSDDALVNADRHGTLWLRPSSELMAAIYLLFVGGGLTLCSACSATCELPSFSSAVCAYVFFQLLLASTALPG